MATKKKKAKKRAVKSPLRGIESQSPMTAPEVKRFQKMLADIGSRKARGFVYIAQIAGDPTDKDGAYGYDAGGIVFVNRMSAAAMVANLVRKLDMNPLELLAIAASVGHSHE